MGYATLVYNASAAAAGATNVDLVAATDADFTQRNGHYTFSEQYKLLRATTLETSATRGRYQAPTWNAIGEFAIAMVNRSLAVPTNYQSDWYGDNPPNIPIEEEFQVQMSNNLGAATEQANVVLDIGTNDWNQNLIPTPPNSLSLVTRASVTITPTVNAWSGPNIIAFSQSLRGGVYVIDDCQVQGADSIAWRWIFPRTKLYNGRKLRPGGIIQTAIGDQVPVQVPIGREFMGVQGFFHTFELPQIEVFGTVAAAITYQLFISLTYLGQSRSILDQYVSNY
jgi:hypothetical protein